MEKYAKADGLNKLLFTLTICALAIVSFLDLPFSGAEEGTAKMTGESKTRDTFFNNSLHAMGEGMRYWYERADGFSTMTHIPYQELDCKGCHVRSCDTCHVNENETSKYFSTAYASKSDICLNCHSRARSVMKFCEKNSLNDVHRKAGMECSDCHTGHDAHGNGKVYKSMREPGAVSVECTDCHNSDPKQGTPAFSQDIEAHVVHDNKLDCSACHVSNSISCNNCHFDEFIRTKGRKGNFIPTQDWLLLMNYQGKVTSASAQTLVTKDKGFVAYAPYTTHCIIKGRQCRACHANANVKEIERGGEVVMSNLVDEKFVPAKGVVPLMEGKLKWNFLDKTEKGWTIIGNPSEIRTQYVGYGTPLTQEQFTSLSEEME